MKHTLSSMSLSALAAGAAIALSIAPINPAEAFTISLNPSNGSTENTGSTALLDFNFVQDGNNVKLNLGVQNTTNGSAGLRATAATLVGIGFDLPSFIKSFTYSAANSTFTKLYGDSKLNKSVVGSAALNPYGTFDVGIRSAGSGNFTGGNPQSGLTAGQSSLVSFLFSGTGLTASSVENSFLSGMRDKSLGIVGRFQQVNAGGGSDKVLGGVVPENSAAVPEPLTILGSITAGMAFLGRKKLQRKAEA